MTFYRDVFGGELSIMTYADMQASEDPAEADKVMHGMLEADHFGMCVDRFGTHWLVNITGSEG